MSDVKKAALEYAMTEAPTNFIDSAGAAFLAGAAWQKQRDLEIIGARAIALGGEGRGRESEGAIDCSNHVAEDAKQEGTKDAT